MKLPTNTWFLVAHGNRVLAVYGQALEQEALEDRRRIYEQTQQICQIYRSRRRFHVGEQLPDNTRVVWPA